MATITERVQDLEMRVGNLETWAGPGQAEALLAGQRHLRTDVTRIKTDLARLRADFNQFQRETQATLAEILRRLPPRAESESAAHPG